MRSGPFSSLEFRGRKGVEMDIRPAYARCSWRIRPLFPTIVIPSRFFASYSLYFVSWFSHFSYQDVIRTVDGCCLEHFLSP